MPFEQIAHYRLLSRLGAGGMGEVFLAEDTRLNRKVAIKRVRPDALDPQAHRRLHGNPRFEDLLRRVGIPPRR